jgi:prepilin-type N-terminal cleavage/methylation domain-containing protein/prepilin-type processing-associated H-X9-DG protein
MPADKVLSRGNLLLSFLVRISFTSLEVAQVQGVNMSPNAHSARSRGFTLVELLVVIGIIALLIAVLMPALSRARESANLVKCAANLREIGQACLMHANEHKQHFPPAGLIHAPFFANPQGLRDTAQVKYSYYNEGAQRRPMPMPAALAPYFGQALRTDSRANLESDMDAGPVREIFTCPSHERSDMIPGTMLGDGGWGAPRIWSSYIFNEEPLGHWDSGHGYVRGRGNMARMKEASEIMMLGDGKPRGTDGWIVVYAHNTMATLEDVFNGSILRNPGYAAGDRAAFDFGRHKKRMNVLFMDGHAETIMVTTRPPTAPPNLATQAKFSKDVYLAKQNF